ncbi:MAG: HXXEE domain-containing protein [Acidobacteriota bacterium]
MSPAPITMRTRWIGAGIVLAAILSQAFWLGLPGILLSVALLVSYGLWISTPWHVAPRLRGAFALAILVFLGHAVEEFLTGFQQALPALFGLGPWPDRQYLLFNGAWALIFCMVAVAVRPVRRLPVLIILFFAVAGGVGNGVLHLLLVLQRGTYFPGAWTAPFCLGVGIWLLRLLYTPARFETGLTSR